MRHHVTGLTKGVGQDSLVKQSPPRDKRPELPALTGVRAIAAAMVVISHIRLPQNAPTWAVHVAESGYIGVPLFFILSGIVLAYNYGHINPRSAREVWNFYVARGARILPLYYAVLIYLAIRREALGYEQLYFWRHVFNIQTWTGSLLAAQQTYNGPAWSINVELFFYALFPLLMPLFVMLSKRFGVRGLASLIVVLAAIQWALCFWFFTTGWADLPAADPASGHRWLYRHPLPRLLEFGMGIALAQILEHRPFERLTDRFHTLIQVAAIAVASIVTVVRPWDGPTAGLWRVASFGALYSIPFILLLWSLASGRGRVARFLSTAPLRSLGVSSFALYLTHRPFLEVLGADVVRESNNLAGWLLMLALLGFTMVIGEGAHRYIERPCHKPPTTLQRR